MAGFLWWMLGGVVVYALLCFGASRMLYYPMQYPRGDWSVGEQLGARDVWIQASDGVTLHGWWIERSGARLATLHLHGNGGNITHRDLSARHIVEAGSSVLLLDYRGYGKSEGRPTERGVYRDAEAAYDWLLRSGYGPERIVLHGESLGTVVAVHLSTHRPCAGVVLEAPFTSAKAVAGRVLPVIGPLVMWGYDSLSRIGQLNVPLLIIHGDADEVIDYSFGKKLFEAAPEPREFWTIPGGTHNDLHILGETEFPIRLKSFYATLESR